MEKIKLLPPELINQIAAGEVVERPASVVKELVENSLDAGADNIVLDMENGGLNLISVTDNGCGMSREDARLSLLQHATSKIRDLSDLFKISTLGFRGEALASIASVADLELRTKEKDALIGTGVHLVDGQLVVGDAGVPAGTTVRVRDLFGRVPARRKYLKTAATEFNHITDLFLNYVVLFPDITWRLSHNGKPVYHFPRAEEKQRLADVLGDEVAKNLLEVDETFRELRVRGYLGKPQIARHNRKLQYLSVNKRPVAEYVIAKQIKDAYATLIPKDLYPVYVLELSVDVSRVDVNVHPRKLEVRFSEPHLIYQTIYQATARALDNHDLTKSFSGALATNFSRPFVPIGSVMGGKRYVPSNDFVSRSFIMPTASEVSTNGPTKQETAFVPPADFNEKIIGQVKDSYIITETAAGMKIYDQHACSERVRYERLKKQWRLGALASQKMLLPVTVEIAAAEKNGFDAALENLHLLGFGVENIGGLTYLVSGVPQFLLKTDIANVIQEIAAALNEPTADKESAGPLDRALKLIACRGAIKFGDKLTPDGMEALLREFSACDNKYSCIHGRPAVVEWDGPHLEKLFFR